MYLHLVLMSIHHCGTKECAYKQHLPYSLSSVYICTLTAGRACSCLQYSPVNGKCTVLLDYWQTSPLTHIIFVRAWGMRIQSCTTVHVFAVPASLSVGLGVHVSEWMWSGCVLCGACPGLMHAQCTSCLERHLEVPASKQEFTRSSHNCI